MAGTIDDDDPWAPLPPGALWSDRAGEVVEGPPTRPPSDWTPPPPLPRKPLPIGPEGLPSAAPPPRYGFAAASGVPARKGGPSAAAAPPPTATGASPVEYGDDEVDPEAVAATADWFLRLPAAEQQRLRAHWQQKRARGGARHAQHARLANRRFLAAVACSVATIFAGTGHLWHATLGAGVCCGIWWRHARPDRFLDPFGAMACFFAMHVLAIYATAAEPHPIGWVDLCVLGSCAAVVGFDGEIRRTGGFDLK